MMTMTTSISSSVKPPAPLRRDRATVALLRDVIEGQHGQQQR
jgi:hypothetical protein